MASKQLIGDYWRVKCFLNGAAISCGTCPDIKTADLLIIEVERLLSGTLHQRRKLKKWRFHKMVDDVREGMGLDAVVRNH